MVVERNGAWDGESRLTVRTVYDTREPDTPYFSDPNDQQLVLVVDGAERLRVDDPTRGSAQWSPAFLVGDLAVVNFGGEVGLVDLGSGSMQVVTEPGWEGLLAGYAPAPDGSSVAALYSLAFALTAASVLVDAALATSGGAHRRRRAEGASRRKRGRESSG